MSILRSELIISLRSEKKLSQEKVATLIGMSRQSYMAVEKGEKELTISEAEKLANIFGVTLSGLLGGERPNYEKYKQMILAYLRMDKTVKKTKLAKLIYLADFAWYYENLESMSGMPYRRLKYGPVPDAYFRALDELELEGKIIIDRKTEDEKEMQVIRESDSNVNQKLETIGVDELALMKQIYKKWQGKKTAEIVNFTHNQLPYFLCRDDEVIPYELITQEDPDKVY